MASAGIKKNAEINSAPKNKSCFFPELDYMRGLAIFAVITTHTLVYYSHMPSLSILTYIYMILIAFAKYGVPAFLFVSGFVLYNKYNTKFNLSDFYLKRYTSIIPQYLIFSFLYELWNRGAITTVFINDLLTGGANQHLWFIRLIIELYIAYPVVMHIFNYFKYHNNTKYFLIIVFIINILYNKYTPSYWLIDPFEHLLGWLFYFVLGMYVRDNYESIDILTIRKNWLLITVLICIGSVSKIIELKNAYLSTSTQSNLLNISIIPPLIDMLDCTALTVAVFYTSLILYKTKKARFISIVGSYSFGIYLIHAYIVVFLAFNAYKFGITVDNIFFYPYVFLGALILSMAAIVLIRQLPYHEYITGKVRSEKTVDERTK